MCLILFAHGVHPQFPLVLAANRDEFLDRPTSSMQWRTNVVCGLDDQAGGTWLGVHRDGRWAAVTNFRGRRESQLAPTTPTSRGELVWDFLHGSQSPADYLAGVHKRAEQYRGFNLLVSDINEVFYFGNRAELALPIRPLGPGIYGLSNDLLNTPWPKVETGMGMLRALCESGSSPDSTALFSLLQHTDRPHDERLPDTGIGLVKERLLSSVFIASDGYGTRCSTVMTVSQNNEFNLAERSFPAASDQSFHWRAST